MLVCPCTPAGRRRPSMRSARRPLQLTAAAHERAVRDSLRHSEGIRADLHAMGLHAEALDGAAVLDLLHARFDPASSESTAPASFMHPDAINCLIAGEESERAADRASALARAICSAPHRLLTAQPPARRRVAGAGAARVARARADMARLAATHDPGATAVRAQRARAGHRALPRAARTEAPLQAPVRRQPRRRAARAPAGPRRAPRRGGGRRADRAARIQQRRRHLPPQRLPRAARTRRGPRGAARARGRRPHAR